MILILMMRKKASQVDLICVLLWAAVASVWKDCVESTDVVDLDVIIDMKMEADSGTITWEVCHDPTFNNYLEHLLPIDSFDFHHPFNVVPFASLIQKQQLDGRGYSILTTFESDPSRPAVFKGIDLRTYLNIYEDRPIIQEVAGFYHSLKLVDKMPRHKNMKAPPPTLVTLHRLSDEATMLCGALEPFVSRGSLGDVIEQANMAGERLGMAQKVDLCLQMAEAIAQTHLVAHTFHMDIKPGNLLIEDDGTLALIDWEQNGVPPTTAAPEVDGTWDAELSADGKLVYTKYKGPERSNMPEEAWGNMGWTKWNVLTLWQEQCPKALELAEVFSVGRSIHMLLRQPDTDGFDDIEDTLEMIEDWDECDDVQSHSSSL
ncbi:hypothetical protein VHEMI07976 [[Torrubiella] hemipterigena]|uniref:Protein kinase domain-containing protein n=1 Tax=[Torrubiella] hemipterigena TaxID=1531966 RepID=A0A0A1T580_9HYPO|nr:hypothetical protein VHEMI07976 [[Torrubiella] hemipterigena]